MSASPPKADIRERVTVCPLCARSGYSLLQTLPGAIFAVNGATPAKNSALVSEGAELRLANGVVLLAKFDGEFASHSTTYAGTGTVRYTW